MTAFKIFTYEFKHFSRSRSKVFCTLLFVFACIYAIYNGFDLQNKQQITLAGIERERQESMEKVSGWFDQGKKGPEDQAWVDVTTPYWSLRQMSSYTVKQPSPLMPLGIGQAEQYGFYKEVTFWSSTHDNDMVEELANPERLVNGNVDFSFMVIYLLPVLMIILTYNVGGLEVDNRFELLIAIQSGSIRKWLVTRFAFYVALSLGTVCFLMVVVGVANGGEEPVWSDLGALLLLAALHVLFFAALFLAILLNRSGTSTTAFAMIGVWLLLCVIVPGTVHQYASMKVPVNYMTDYLDVNRKETYATYALPPEAMLERLLVIYPTLTETRLGTAAEMDNSAIQRSVGAIINDMNKGAIAEIEARNEGKNALIRSTYWFNPVSFVQNRWNAHTATDYDAYRDYRQTVQGAIDKKMELLVFETWNQVTVDKDTLLGYERELKQF